MSRYPLARLHDVRKHAEEEAALAVGRCTMALEQARADLVRREDELAQYIKWRIKEEALRFEKIRNTEISLAQVERYKQDILTLRGNEVQYEERILQAKRHIKECEEQLDTARLEHVTAIRERRKFDEHQARWLEEDRRERERAEELELEDFTVRTPE